MINTSKEYHASSRKNKYQDFLKSDYWDKYRKTAYKFFGNRCWFCRKHGELHLHHTRYYKTTFFSNRKIKNNLRWFLVICKDCHKAIHKIGKEKHLEPYKATKLFRDLFYPNIKMWISKSQIKTA